MKNYSPGKFGLPHMGEVIADYRIKAGWTSQETFAVVCGVDKQSVVHWENQDYISSMERRIFLCKLLKISPGLLGLTWRSVLNEDDIPLYVDVQNHMTELLNENAYGVYEDLLTFARAIPNKYAPDISYRFYKHQQELEKIVKEAPELERDMWIDLLCRYYQHSTFISQHHKKDKQALAYADKAVELATQLSDKELEVGSLYRRARIHLMQNTPEKQDIEGALQKLKQVHGSYKGSTYLLAAEIYALYSQGDETLENQCKKWQADALTLSYKERNDENGTRIMFTPYAVHHERAKTLLRFALFHENDDELVELLLQHPNLRPKKDVLKDAQEALILADKQASEIKPLVYPLHLRLTEAKYYLLSRDFEESAKRVKQALQISRQKHSQQGIEDAKQFYCRLHTIAPNNPYIVNLGVELGVFPD